MSTKAKLRTAKRSTWAQLAEQIGAGDQPPLTAAELSPVKKHLRKAPETWAAWRLLLTAPYDAEIGELAATALHDAERLDATKAVHSFSLMYLLAKTPGEGLISKFRDARCTSLRMVIAQRIAERDITSGLRMMIDILPDANTGYDHATVDSIALWLSDRGTGAFKRELLEMAAELLRRQDAEAAGCYEWAASQIP